MGDPIRAAERSESAVGLAAAVRRVFRASEKNRSEVKGLSEKLVAWSIGKLHDCALEAQALPSRRRWGARV